MRKAERAAVEELATLLDAGVPVERMPAEARALAVVAASVRNTIDVPAPRPAFVEELRSELLAAAAATPVSTSARHQDRVEARLRAARRPWRVAVAASTAGAVLATGGVTAVAQEAMPGEPLYPVKRISEQARLALANGPQRDGRLYLTFAHERLLELVDGLSSLDQDELVATLDEMNRSTVAASENLTVAFSESGDQSALEELRDFATEQSQQLGQVLDRLPLSVQETADDAMSLLSDVRDQADYLERCGDCVDLREPLADGPLAAAADPAASSEAPQAASAAAAAPEVPAAVEAGPPSPGSSPDVPAAPAGTTAAAPEVPAAVEAGPPSPGSSPDVPAAPAGSDSPVVAAPAPAAASPSADADTAAPTTSPSRSPVASPSEPAPSPAKTTTSPAPPTTSPAPPTTSPAPAPTTSPAPEPVSSPAPEPVSSPAPEPVSSPGPEPVSSPAPEPVSSPAPAPPTTDTAPSPSPTAAPEPTPVEDAAPTQTAAPPPDDDPDPGGGPPADAGPPDQAGPPPQANAPANAGPPAHAGPPGNRP